MTTMNVRLSSEMVDFVEHDVATVDLASSCEVMRKVAAGLSAAAQGDFSSRSALDIARQVASE
ncbi:hypothetical protein ACHMW5_17650 [Azospirillum melinis]|uniref:hypothetical protein n=1 Tax=Azospirillum melinis TaxID=328839 RepID=UPI003756D66F